MNSSAPILINKHLSAIDMKSLVLANPKHQAAFIRGDVVVEAAVPLSADGSLRPGELYESTGGADVYFYLPTYTLRRVAGQFTTRLKLRDAQQEPEGPLAWLTTIARHRAIDLMRRRRPETSLTWHDADGRVTWPTRLTDWLRRSHRVAAR